MVAEEVSHLRRSEENQDVIGDEGPCSLTEGSAKKNAAQPDQREAVIAF